MNPDPTVLALLFDRGAAIEATDELGRTPLLVAVTWFPSPATIGLLLDRGANMEATDWETFTPLLRARVAGKYLFLPLRPKQYGLANFSLP